MVRIWCILSFVIILFSVQTSAQEVAIPQSVPIINFFELNKPKPVNEVEDVKALIAPITKKPEETISTSAMPGFNSSAAPRFTAKSNMVSEDDVAAECPYKVRDDAVEYTKKDEIAAIIDGFRIHRGDDGKIKYFIGKSVSPELLEGIKAAIEKYELAADLKFAEVKNICEAHMAFEQREKLRVDSDEKKYSGYATMSRGVHVVVIKNNKNYKPGSFYFSVVLHEMGHALGLKHSGHYNDGDKGPYLDEREDRAYKSVMSYSPRLGITSKDLGPLDKEALQFLYGKSTNKLSFFE